MIKVTPMDDELAIGHEGRIAWINAVANQREFDRLMAATLSQSEQRRLDKPSKLGQLAAHAEMSPTDYARKHSMLPVFRVAAKQEEDLKHGDAQGESFNRRLGMLTQKHGAYLCKACVNDDLKKRKSSWYRREHHLHGIDWCSTHQQPLSRVTAPDPWSAMPHHWVEEDGEVENGYVYVPNEADKLFLTRYAALAELLLKRDHPFEVRAIGYLIGRKAQNLGLRVSRRGLKPTISDHIRSRAPAQWLKKYFEHIGKNERSVFLQQIDGAAISRTIPASGHVYVLVLTAFFDSAHEAVQYLNTGVPTELLEHVKTPARRDAKFWHGELWEIYVKCGGQITKMAAMLGMDKKYLQERMLVQGLPSLHNVSSSSNWRALVRLHQGESFRRACELENIDETELEVLLRTVNPKVVALVLKILEDAYGEYRFSVSGSLKRQQLPSCDLSVMPVPQKPVGQKSHQVSDLTAFEKNKNWSSLDEMKAA